MSWTAVLVLSVGAYVFKAAGVTLGGRFRNEGFIAATMLIPPALFAALIMVQTFAEGTSLTVDARAVGVLAAVVAAWRRAGFAVVLAVAMSATALVRLLA